MKHSVAGRSGLNHCWTHCGAFIGCDEGRACELSRRVTCMVLLSRNGRPGTWLAVVAMLWAVVTATAIGTPG